MRRRGLYALAPRRPDLRAFDPDQFGRLEASVWRHYYRKEYTQLAYDLYGAARQTGFSPGYALLAAVRAARAVSSFQTSRSEAEAQQALPALVAYFRTIAHAAPSKFDIEEAARSELSWWQARRMGSPPEQYGLTIAHVSKLMYGVDSEAIRQAGILRARAMNFHDKKGTEVSEADWAAIMQQLIVSYRVLKTAITQR
jgi:hypothetical protein